MKQVSLRLGEDRDDSDGDSAEKEDLLLHVATSGWTNFLLLQERVPGIGFGSVISPHFLPGEL